MTDFLASLDEPTQAEQDQLSQAIPLVLSELANENHLIKQELLRQSQDLHELRIQVAGALFLLQKSLGQEQYGELTGQFNELVANQLKNPTGPSEESSSDGQAVS